MHYLACLYTSMGKLDEAVAMYETLIPLRKKELGENHSHTLESTDALASLHKTTCNTQHIRQYC